MKVDEKLIKKMLEDNEHNKHTTLYYLLAKKKERGDLELEKELEEYAEKEMKKEQDKLKFKDRKSKVPAPLADLTKPEMYDARSDGQKRIENEKRARQVSRSISTSVDHNYINEILQKHSTKNKITTPVGISKGESIDLKKKHDYIHIRKKSNSKSKVKRPNSRDAQLRMYIYLI